MPINNKTILVVGASSGIGREVARKFGENNNQIIICARRRNELEKLSKEIEALGSTALAIPVDALDQIQASNVITQTIEKFGTIDIALLNVGDGPSFNMSRATVDDITHNMDINYTSMVNFLVPLIAQMKMQGFGIIAHTNSLAGFIGLPMQGPYSAAKSASRILLDSCRTELKPFGVKFVSVYPGFIATDRVQDNGIPAPFEISEQKAAAHIIKAIEKEKSDYLFPFVTASLIRVARLLPKRITQYLVSKSIPEDY